MTLIYIEYVNFKARMPGIMHIHKVYIHFFFSFLIKTWRLSANGLNPEVLSFSMLAASIFFFLKKKKNQMAQVLYYFASGSYDQSVERENS